MKLLPLRSNIKMEANSESEYSHPDEYWERRLGQSFNLRGSGYGLLGPTFNQTLYAARLRALDKALRDCGTTISGRSVLDIGCGTGFYAELCKREGAASYTGVDLTEVSVSRLGQRYPSFRFIRADVGSDSFGLTDQFDLIIAGDVLFHIVDDGRHETAIRNMGRCLGPSGRLALSDVLPLETVQLVPHCRFRALAVYERVLAKHDMAIERVQPIFGALQPPLMVRGSGLGWKTYALIWQAGLTRLARFGWFDRRVPVWLDWLDRRILLPRARMDIPNSKWLIARKGDVSQRP